MRRCFQLARLGRGYVSPNPCVGAVVAHEGKVIGEGYHPAFGQPHAEVFAIQNVADKGLLPHSTLYVSLEPCCHFGKTPPCTELILSSRIPRVVLSCLDPNPLVAGKGVAKLAGNGVEVKTGVLEKEGKEAIREFSTGILEKRPWVILKFARSVDGFMGKHGEQFWLSNVFSKRLTHKWRSEIDAILVGSHTALADNPALTNRHFWGKSPLRVVLDRKLELPRNLQLFDQTHPTWVVTQAAALPPAGQNLTYVPLPFDECLLPELLKKLHQAQVGILMVEGGAITLQKFLDSGLWDEARVLESPLTLSDGILAPRISLPPADSEILGSDCIRCYFRQSAISSSP